MKRTMLVLSCLLLATPVVAQSGADKAGSSSTLSPTTLEFIQKAAVSDLFETASAKLALAHGNPAEKQFANQMIQDHGKTSSELKSKLTAGLNKVELPNELDSAHQAKLDLLNKARGEDFITTYASQQVEAHNDAVTLFESYAKSGDQAELKTWAGDTLPALKHHLEIAQKLTASSPTVGSSTSK
jgi:putative membrane protein